MASVTSSTKNVKLGVCRVYFAGDDLGVTQGGVDVTVTTDTHEVMVDQFGKTPINENIMGRHLVVKVPMAETTLENLARVMPGATISQTGGVSATGTVTVATNPIDSDFVTVNGTKVTFRTVVALASKEVAIGATAGATAANLSAFLNKSDDPSIAQGIYTVAAAIVTATYQEQGVDGNLFTLAAGQASITVSGATLTGGVDPTIKSIAVTHGIGHDLLATAAELRLHPVAKDITDRTDDFIIPLANTAGGLNFSYKVDAERIFNVEFKGYPDPVTGVMFVVGDAG